MILLTILIGICLQAQKEQEEFFGTWVVVAGNNRISEKFSIPTVGILRHYELFKHYEFAFIRTGLTYQITPNVSGTLGYAFLDSEPFVISPEAKGVRQHWMYEELSLTSPMGKLDLSHRYRLESRWLLKDEGTVLNHRMRYRLQLKYPIGQKLYINFFNETFVAFQEPLFNQNRLQLGLGYKASSSIRLELGYLKNHFNNVDYDRIRAALLFKTDFRKKPIP